MAQASANPTPGKRSLQDLEPLLSEGGPAAKRACTESPPASAHLTLLEELCDLEEGDAESSVSPSATVASPQEDLVAEMMKSLEKVLEEAGESRETGEASTSRPTSDSPSPVPDPSPLDFAWANGGYPSSENDSRANGDLVYEEELDGDAQIRHLLQLSDDELGIPASASSSDLEDSSFHEEWASLSDQSGPSSALNFNWLVDTPFPQFEEPRELYEPVVLF